LAPVPSGTKVRGRFTLADVKEKRPGQFLITYDITVEAEGVSKPALVAKWLCIQNVAS
jgi:acyl dehydratase